MTREHPAETLPEGVTALVRRGAVYFWAHQWSGVWFESGRTKATDAPDAWIEVSDDAEAKP